MRSLPPSCMLAAAIGIAALLCAGAPVSAQRGAEVGRLPASMTLPSRDITASRGPDALPVRLPSVATVRAPFIERLVRRHRDVLDLDPAGAPVVRSEVVALDPAPDALQRARDAGFSIAGEHLLDELGIRIVVLRSRPGVSTRKALRTLRELDPRGQYDFNHLYLGSAASVSGDAAAYASPAAIGGPVRVGLIDSGVASDHPAFAGVEIRTWGCGGRVVPDAHGTAVASLLVGGGASAPGGALFAADIYCGQPTGGAVTGYVDAMAWMTRERVAVINLSLVGPHNVVLQRATRALSDRGHVLVAAVGNDGPAAPPLFPASYPDVIGVTAVDRRERALPEAGRGLQVDFAAPGSDLRTARPDGTWDRARGTSFAAPLVARVAAAYVSEPGTGRSAEVREHLAGLARDLGPKGRDDIYGHGLLEAPLPTAHAGAR